MDINAIQTNVDNILKEALVVIANTSDEYSIDQAKAKYLGKNGCLTEILKGLKDVDPVLRPKVGQIINFAKEQIIQQLQKQQESLKASQLALDLAKDAIDITLPGRGLEFGSLHPLTKVRYRIENFFASMGFSVLEGPEIEDDYHNFTALNIPANHPARDEHDTFYFADGTLLRTHTSPMQIRTMKKTQKEDLPLKMIVPGKVYRCDLDSTHSPMFHQIEGLVVDKNINFGNLKWLLNRFLEYFFNAKVKVRFRPSYFQFTEPSAEVDIWIEDQKRWLEVLGCGMVHPNVLKAVDFDPEEYSGLAVGMGIERLAMLYYKIDDLRMFFENDLEFLEQF